MKVESKEIPPPVELTSPTPQTNPESFHRGTSPSIERKHSDELADIYQPKELFNSIVQGRPNNLGLILGAERLKFKTITNLELPPHNCKEDGVLVLNRIHDLLENETIVVGLRRYLKKSVELSYDECCHINDLEHYDNYVQELRDRRFVLREEVPTESKNFDSMALVQQGHKVIKQYGLPDHWKDVKRFKEIVSTLPRTGLGSRILLQNNYSE